jgi:hypothetical protein
MVRRTRAVFFGPPVNSDASENKTLPSLSRTFLMCCNFVVERKIGVDDREI